MKKITLLFFLFNFCTHAQIITTIAGTGQFFSNSGDGGPAILAQIETGGSIAADSIGNIYFFDGGSNGGIRKIDTNGIITHFAGIYGSHEDSVPAINSRVGAEQMIFDRHGNMIISDGRQRVRKIDKQGIITTIAGTYTVSGYSGDGGLAVHAKFNRPFGLAYDSKGNLYISDLLNYVIRKVDTQGVITTIAGVGAPGNTGDGGPASQAQIYAFSLAVDSLDNLYLDDSYNSVIRKIDTNGIITRVIGKGYIWGNPDTNCLDSSGLWTPLGICFDKKGQLCYSEAMTGTIRQINKNGTVYTIAGVFKIGPNYSGDGGLAVDALIQGGQACFDRKGNLYTSDGYNNRIRKVTYDGSSVVGIKEEKKENSALKIWPNPATDVLNVGGSKDIITGDIYDANGRLVLESKENKIDISHLANGLYLITLKTDKQIITRKFTKE